jgi:hypothetical protein
MSNWNHKQPSIDQINAVLVSIGKKLDGEENPEHGTPDQKESPEWRGADVIITSDFTWAPQHFADAHDLVVRTRHAGQLAWLLRQVRDAFESWLDAGNKYGFYGSLAGAALEHLAAHQPEPDDPRPLMRAALDRTFLWLQVLRDQGEIPDNAICVLHLQDIEGRQVRIDLQTGRKTT